jgi:prepilin-type processing-associated H-X9-DG protein
MLKRIIICVCLVVWLSPVAWAANQNVLKHVDDLAYGVIRLDVKALDFSNSVDALLGVAGKTLEARKVQHLKNGVARSREMMESDLTAFQKAGGREIYAIFSMRDISAFFLAFPVDSGVDQARLQSAIQAVAKKSFKIRDLSLQSHGQVILAGKTQTLEATKALTREANPLWASLLDTRPLRALRLVIVPDPMQLRVLREMWPQMLGVPGMDQLGTLLQGCKWVTISAQAVPGMAIEVVLNMQTEVLAGDVVAFWRIAVPLMTQPLHLDKTIPGQIPIRRKGSQVILSVDHQKAEWLLGQILLGPAYKALAFTEQMTCGTNVSGMGKACLIYANDHDDQLPPDLDTLMDVARMPKNCAMPQKGLICPATGTKGSYGYCADGLDCSCEPTLIVAYDKKGNHPEGYRNVLFLDTHVEWITEARFQALTAKVNAVRKERGLKAHVFE